MLQLHCYPDGKKRVVTFSYDDGSENDARLTELFNRYGVKGPFHLNGGRRSRGGGSEATRALSRPRNRLSYGFSRLAG